MSDSFLASVIQRWGDRRCLLKQCLIGAHFLAEAAAEISLKFDFVQFYLNLASFFICSDFFFSTKISSVRHKTVSPSDSETIRSQKLLKLEGSFTFSPSLNSIINVYISMWTAKDNLMFLFPGSRQKLHSLAFLLALGSQQDFRPPFAWKK